jgi:hypothetical protein
VVLTLSNPRLTTAANATATLTFDATLITDEHPDNLKRLTSGIHKTPPAAFANASLFIDDVSSNLVTVACVSTDGRTVIDDVFLLPMQQSEYSNAIDQCQGSF